MTYQHSVALRNARLDVEQTFIGVSPILRMFTRPEPVNCAAPDPGGLIVQMTLPASWMQPAAGGSKQLAGLWAGLAQTNGTIASFRIYDPTGTTCHIQGSVSVTGGGGDMQLDQVVVIGGAQVAVTQYTVTAGNP